MALTKKLIAKMVHDLGLGDSEDEPVATVMLAALECGANAAAISEFLGWPRGRVRAIGRGLRAAGIWKHRETHHSGWFDEDSGGIAFVMDLAVYKGLLERLSA